jgi:hypothetical protein
MVKINIYDILGRLITSLADNSQSPGNYDLRWNALNQSGGRTGKGIYFYHIYIDDYYMRGKLMYTK